MDAEEIVLANFPKAEAREEAPVYQHGKLSAIMPGYWAIHPDADLDSEELGNGRTEAQAWKNAASKMRTLAAAAT
jgi:hypothetical protein